MLNWYLPNTLAGRIGLPPAAAAEGRIARVPEFTLTTGPAGVYPRVLNALSQPITHYYDPAFLECFRRTETKVAKVFGTTNEIILLQGEAVLGLEAAARSLVRPGMAVLNLVSGVYGSGMSLWLKSFGAQLHELSVAYDEAIDPDDVEAYLDAHPEIELLCVVHCETPSGTLNDCSRIGPIARAHGVLTLVDCVASLGGMPVDPDGWQLDVCVAAPQKCLGATPGMSLIAVSPYAWAAIERNPAAPRGSFLSLLDWRERWHGLGRFPYTPSVSDIHGLEAACDLFLEEGREAVFARHEIAARVCRAGIEAMGLRLWPARHAIMSACVTAVVVPDDLDQAAVCDYVRARYGVLISGSEGAGNLVRIGHMGLTASGFHPVVGLTALGRSLADLGADVRIGDGVDAALAVLSELRRGQ
jgi:pyridoxamine---pyruvate transaminase